MVLKNKIGRVYAPGKVDFIEKEVPAPQPDQVIVKVVASAICGSDMHIYKGKHPTVPLPATIGHEFSGDVVQVGSEVTKIKVGDRVTVEPSIVCGKCDACRHGEYGYCEEITFTYREGEGSMANYVTVKEPYVYILPEGLSYEAGALIEPLAVATHAVRRADVKLGENVLVLGAGAIGILVAALSRLSGAGEVIVSDFSQHRLDLALEMGATRVVNLSKNESVEDMVEKVTGGTGMDKTFECVGRESTFIQAMENLKRNGLATVVGIFEKPEITINAMRFINYEIKVQGAQGYQWDFPIALKMIRDIDLNKLVTHTFPMSELGQALETCFTPEEESIKVLLKP